jgi:hypothetical protein
MDLECEEEVEEILREVGSVPDSLYVTLLKQTKGSELTVGRENPYEHCPCQICGH